MNAYESLNEKQKNYLIFSEEEQTIIIGSKDDFDSVPVDFRGGLYPLQKFEEGWKKWRNEAKRILSNYSVISFTCLVYFFHSFSIIIWHVAVAHRLVKQTSS